LLRSRQLAAYHCLFGPLMLIAHLICSGSFPIGWPVYLAVHGVAAPLQVLALPLSGMLSVVSDCKVLDFA
jgi:hypothetical protein